MKPIWIILLVVLAVGNIVGGYILYKAFQLRGENAMLQKYLADMTAKNKTLAEDYAGTSVYAKANRQLLEATTPEERQQICVLYGASITKRWDIADQYDKQRLINRGIGAQSSAQLLSRFSSDVLQLQPGRVVLKMCAGNFEPNLDGRTVWDQFETMALAAQARGIEPVIATMVPVTHGAEIYDGYSITEETRRFNELAREFAHAHNLTLIDYFKAMADGEGFLPDAMARDAIHPNEAGYEKMSEAFRAGMK